MTDYKINQFKQDMRTLLPMFSSDAGGLGEFGKDVASLAGECRDLLDALDREPAMDTGVLQDKLKLVSEQIEKTIQVLTEAHVKTFRTMTSIGNRKRIQKAYE